MFDFRHLKQQSLRPFNHFEFTFGFDTITNSISVRSFQLSDTSSKDVLSGTKIDGEWKLSGLPENLLPHVRPSFEHFLPNFQGHGKRPSDTIAAAAMDLIFSSRIRTAALSDFFEKMLYVGPIRNLIPRYGFMGTQSYSELNPSGQNLMRVLSSRKLKGRERKTLMEQLNYWLDTKFKVLSNVRIEDIDAAKTIKAIVADDPRGDKHINLAAMGTGLSQLVPVIVQTVLTPPGGTLLIEQPEIHLHPKAQAALGDLFVTYAKQRRQLIVETHSEHLLLRIRRRIAEGQIDANDVRIFFVDKNKSHTRVRQLRLDNKGHFAQWPAGFFEEGYREAMAIAMAQVEKKCQ